MDNCNSAAEQSHGHSGLCVKGCGFFGNPSSNGMCSKCFKESQHRQEEQSKHTSDGKLCDGLAPPSGCRLASHAATPYIAPNTDRLASDELPTASAVTSEAVASSSVCGEELEAVVESPSAAVAASCSPTLSPSVGDDAPKKSKKSRCEFDGCRSRVGLLGFDCRCGLKFCSKHRYSDQHNCTFDYKTDGRALLEKAHPAVVAAKVGKL